MTDNEEEPDKWETLREEISEVRMGSLNVHVDYLDLVESVGEEEAYIVLGKLKDLLG